MLFDSFEAMEIVIITEEMLEVFKGCADYVVPCDNWSVTIAPELKIEVIRKTA